MQLDFHHGLLESPIPNPRPPSVRADRVWQPANIVRMLKVELHAHTADDPEDFVPHTVERLVDRVAELGYDAVAITLHNR